jgi:hypothetical protein
MPLFPMLAPEYYDDRDRGIKSRMEVSYAESISINQAFWSEASIDTRFMAGDQTIYNDLYGNVPAARRRQFNFNRIARVVNMVDGHQRQNRKSIIATGIENADDETADQFTKALMWVNQQEGVLETISTAFRGSLITGMNLLQVWMDYRSDPISGNIRVDSCAYNTFLMDPFFKKQDLSDCNYIWKRSYLTKRECISLLPDYADQIIGLYGNDNRDGKFQYQPESYNFDMKHLLTYDEYYYKDYRKQKMLVDTQTGEVQEWRGQDEEKLKEFLRAYPQITMIESEIPTVKLAIVVQGKTMYDGPNPMGIDQYPFVPVFAYYYPELEFFQYRIQGMVRTLRDPQYLYNRRKVIELDILESQINSGWIYKENALVNPKDVFLSGQGRGLALKDDAQMTDVQQIQSPAIPPTTIELSRILGQEISEISGVNEELLGSATDDKAGILSMLRQGAGLTTLQILFDNLDRSQKILGKIMIDLIQANFTPGKMKKILEDEEPTDQFYNKAFGRYDAVVEDGLNTTTQKQMQFSQLLHLRGVGVPVPDDVLLNASTMQNKKELIEAIQAAKQQAEQQQQAQAQSAMDLQSAQAELARARSLADVGLYNERTSRVQENFALAEERRSEAVQNENQALLNLVKAMKEVEGLDLEHLAKIVELQNLIKVQEAENQVSSKTTLKEQTPEEKKLQDQQLIQQPQQQPMGV